MSPMDPVPARSRAAVGDVGVGDRLPGRNKTSRGRPNRESGGRRDFDVGELSCGTRSTSAGRGT